MFSKVAGRAQGSIHRSFLDVIATMPETGPLGQVHRSARSLLALSDLLCDVADLDRYQSGSGEKHSRTCLRVTCLAGIN